MKTEIEARFVIEDTDKFFAMLTQKGFEEVHPEKMMKRFTYSIPSLGDNCYARIRDEGGKVTATVKHIHADELDGVKEAEVDVANFDDAHALFMMLGMKKKAYQETKRAYWVGHGVELMVDTWPGIPTFVEIEGSTEDSVKVIADMLGFDWSEASFGAIDTLYERFLGFTKGEINFLPEITFANPPASQK